MGAQTAIRLEQKSESALWKHGNFNQSFLEYNNQIRKFLYVVNRKKMREIAYAICRRYLQTT
jgi:hypothetical protein